MARSRAFYERALQPLGVRVIESSQGPGNTIDDREDFWIMEQEMAAGSVHIAFAAPDREALARYHAEVAGRDADNEFVAWDGYGMTEDEAVADAVRHGRIVEIGQAKVMPASLSAPKDDDDFSAAELHRIVADKNENPGAAAAAADMLWGNLRPRRVGPRTEANVDALSTDAINAILERTIRTTAAAREAAKRVAEWFGFEVSEPTRPRP